MKIIVQKFGGTSVKDTESRKEAQKHIVAAIEEGYKVVVVVSAIGRKGAPYATDSLLSLVGSDGTHLSAKELDALLAVGETISASVFTEMLLSADVNATYMTGGEAGIITNEDYGNAKVQKIDTERIMENLEVYDVVVVTGFQGMTEKGVVTTIGRGGSDTSAALLGVAMNAEFIDIFTDVSGIMTADPRIVKDAEFIESLTFQEVANLAQNGAGVIHPRAVEIAMQGNIPLRIRSTNEDVSQQGTYVGQNSKMIEHYRLVTGVTHVDELTQLTIEGDGKDLVQLLKDVKDCQISIDFVNMFQEALLFTVSRKDSEAALELVKKSGLAYKIKEHCAKVSVVGAGIAGVPGVVYQIANCFLQAEIPILQVADSHTTIWVLIENNHLQKAIMTLHSHFFPTSSQA